MGIYPKLMRQITILVSLIALFFTSIEPAIAGRQGVPGRRVGGGTRWTTPPLRQAASPQKKLKAMAFASRNNLPISLRLKTLYG